MNDGCFYNSNGVDIVFLSWFHIRDHVDINQIK